MLEIILKFIIIYKIIDSMILFGYLGEILCIFKYNKSKIKQG